MALPPQADEQVVPECRNPAECEKPHDQAEPAEVEPEFQPQRSREVRAWVGHSLADQHPGVCRAPWPDRMWYEEQSVREELTAVGVTEDACVPDPISRHRHLVVVLRRSFD